MGKPIAVNGSLLEMIPLLPIENTVHSFPHGPRPDMMQAFRTGGSVPLRKDTWGFGYSHANESRADIYGMEMGPTGWLILGTFVAGDFVGRNFLAQYNEQTCTWYYRLLRMENDGGGEEYPMM